MSAIDEILEAVSSIFNTDIRFFSMIHRSALDDSNEYLCLGHHEMFIIDNDFNIVNVNREEVEDEDSDDDNIVPLRLPYRLVERIILSENPQGILQIVMVDHDEKYPKGNKERKLPCWIGKL